MVDIGTAMTAASAQGQRGRRAGGGQRSRREKDEPKRRETLSEALEPFDVAKHVAKERAETVSMWLVLACGVVIALVTRFILLPLTGAGETILWLLPLLLVATIPYVHRVLPKSFHEHYSNGT